MKQIFSFLVIVVLMASCTATTQIAGESRGAAFEVKKPMSYDNMIAKLEKQGGIEDVQVTAKVKEVCKKKGCWMTLYSDNTNTEMVVKFKDYGFFMPLDISGKTVVMKGNAYKETTPVEELRHLAEDGGKSEEEIAKITEPKVEWKFEATGVIIKKEG